MTPFATDETHDPTLASWVPGANDPATDFPIQNLPYGRFRVPGADHAWRIGVAIGDRVLDLNAAAAHGSWDADIGAMLVPLAAGDLNAFMARPAAQRRALRLALSRALRSEGGQQGALEGALVEPGAIELGVPCRIGDYTDFYASLHHATTVGRQFRPDNPLLPNYKWVPIGYHGRASSVIASGQRFLRPRGQTKAPDASAPSVGPTRRLDYELEVAVFVATPNALGEPIAIDQAEDHAFGLALFNDWSARDIQGWEYQPLGPFLAKNFASTVSPWIVTMDALRPFRAPFERDAADPQPLPYLDAPANRAAGAVDLALEVWLQSAAMREAGTPAHRLSASNFRDAYWTLAQLIAHHTVGGCNLQPGDLLGSGTISGPRPEEAGSLLELSQGGREPLTLPGGEQRSFLEDGDTVTLRGRCERAGWRGIGFGACTGTVLPARA